LNRDGFADLVVAGKNVVQIWIGDGGNSWTNTLTYSVPKLIDCVDMTIDDMDHNGFPDILFWGTYSKGFNNVSAIKMLKENSVQSNLDIALTYPKGSEYFPNKSARFIKWNCAVPDQHASTVRIDLSVSGVNGPWKNISAAAPNNGTYQWTVPK